MPRYVVRRPHYSNEEAKQDILQQFPDAKDLKIEVDKKRKIRYGSGKELYRISFVTKRMNA